MGSKAQFKVGDRVRFTDECSEHWWFGPHTKNKEGEIVSPDTSFGYKWRVRIGGSYGYVDDDHIEPVTLTIREGHYYRTRDGRKVGPAVCDCDLYFVGGLLYRSDGRFYGAAGPYHLDIISEWVDDPAAPAAPTDATGYTVPLCAYEDDFDICGYREPAGSDGDDDIVQLSVGELTAALAASLKVARKVGKPIKRGDLVVLARPALVTGVDRHHASVQTDGGNYSLPLAALTAA